MKWIRLEFPVRELYCDYTPARSRKPSCSESRKHDVQRVTVINLLCHDFSKSLEERTCRLREMAENLDDDVGVIVAKFVKHL